MEIVTIEKSELLGLIEDSVARAVERVLRPPDEIMTTEELCRHLRRSRATIRRYVRDGMPQHGPGRFRRSTVDAWLAEH